MTALVQEHTGQKDDLKDHDRQTRITRQGQEYCLYLAMQKPLKQYQRQEQSYKPEKSLDLH
jgi:hypothetical protein